jgi:hypothetical protein
MAEVARKSLVNPMIQGPTPGITTEWLYVTPAMARQWLDHNTLNRAMRPLLAHHHAQDLVDGRFQVTHQGIAFDVNDVLVDGQHRLEGIVLADEGAWLLVTRGLDPTVRAVVDAHGPRPMRDRMVLVGFDWVSGITIATLRRMLASFSPITTRSLRPTEVQMALRVHEAALAFTEDCFKTSVRAVTLAAVRAVIARAFYTVDHLRLRAFAHVLVTGMPSELADTAAITLRNALLGSVPSARSAVQQVAIYAKTERALMAFVKRQELTKIYEAKAELFPLPEEQRTARGRGPA